MTAGRWVLKSEPETYSYARLEREGRGRWDGVRGAQARGFLARMQPGDLGFFYHTGAERACVGIVRVLTTAYPDPTQEPGEARWLAVDVEPVGAVPRPVTLAQFRSDPQLAESLLCRQSRLSVVPLEVAAFRRVAHLGGVAAPLLGGRR